MTQLAVKQPIIDNRKIRKKIGRNCSIRAFGLIDEIGYQLQDFFDRNTTTLSIHDVPVRLSDTARVVMDASYICMDCRSEATHYVIHRETNLTKHPYSISFFHVDPNHGIMMHTKDHVIPKSLGGKDIMENYQNYCYDCNQKKGNSLSMTDIAYAVTPTHIGNEVPKSFASEDYLKLKLYEYNVLGEIYKRQRYTLTKKESVDIHYGKAITKSTISVLNEKRLKQLMIAEKGFFRYNQLRYHAESNIVLPWYLKPFKKVIIKVFKNLLATNKIPDFINQHKMITDELDKRKNKNDK